MLFEINFTSQLTLNEHKEHEKSKAEGVSTENLHDLLYCCFRCIFLCIMKSTQHSIFLSRRFLRASLNIRLIHSKSPLIIIWFDSTFASAISSLWHTFSLFFLPLFDNLFWMCRGEFLFWRNKMEKHKKKEHEALRNLGDLIILGYFTQRQPKTVIEQSSSKDCSTT